jgi:hypothetical protein
VSSCCSATTPPPSDSSTLSPVTSQSSRHWLLCARTRNVWVWTIGGRQEVSVLPPSASAPMKLSRSCCCFPLVLCMQHSLPLGISDGGCQASLSTKLNSFAIGIQGKLYFFRQHSPYSGEINPPLPEETYLFLPPPKLIAKCPGSCHNFLYKLVECNSAMVTTFLVYRLADLILESIVPMTSIGGNSLFIDWNQL